MPIGIYACFGAVGRPDAQATFKLLCTIRICGSAIPLGIHAYRYTRVFGCGAGTQVAV